MTTPDHTPIFNAFAHSLCAAMEVLETRRSERDLRHSTPLQLKLKRDREKQTPSQDPVFECKRSPLLFSPLHKNPFKRKREFEFLRDSLHYHAFHIVTYPLPLSRVPSSSLMDRFVDRNVIHFVWIRFFTPEDLGSLLRVCKRDHLTLQLYLQWQRRQWSPLHESKRIRGAPEKTLLGRCIPPPSSVSCSSRSSSLVSMEDINSFV